MVTNMGPGQHSRCPFNPRRRGTVPTVVFVLARLPSASGMAFHVLRTQDRHVPLGQQSTMLAPSEGDSP